MMTTTQEEVIELIRLAMEAKSGEAKGFIIDGFPVSSAQAKLFEEKIGSPSKILYLCVNDVILKERLVKRSNFDDQPDAINKRIETFNSQTKEVTKEYKSLVSTVSILSSLSTSIQQILLFRLMVRGRQQTSSKTSKKSLNKYISILLKLINSATFEKSNYLRRIVKYLRTFSILWVIPRL